MAKIKDTFEDAKGLFGHVFVGLKDLKWNDIPEPVRKPLEDHPFLTAFEIVLVLFVLCPWLIGSPALLAGGFGALGPTAGGLGAANQSVYGATMAFRTLQSAGMFGPGLQIVNLAVQAPAAFAIISAELKKWRAQQPQQNEAKEALGSKERAKL